MKIAEGVDLVRCKTCKVTLTVDDVPGHAARHKKEAIVTEHVGRWIPWALRGSHFSDSNKNKDDGLSNGLVPLPEGLA